MRGPSSARAAAGLRYFALLPLACAAVALGACGAAESVPVEAASASDAAVADPRPVVLFLGTSLTAGYGLPAEAAFPALLQQRIDAAGFEYRVVNAGVSGDTSAGGLRRIDWLLRLPVAVLVLELGANDMLRGLSTQRLRENLREIARRTRDAHPDSALVVAGMRATPNLGRRYVREFEAVYPEFAEEFDGALVPFLLDGVAGESRLNQADGIHPSARGHRVIADHVWPTLEPVLRER